MSFVPSLYSDTGIEQSEENTFMNVVNKSI